MSGLLKALFKGFTGAAKGVERSRSARSKREAQQVRPQEATGQVALPPDAALDWPVHDEEPVDVVGEASYQAGIRRALAKAEGSATMKAMLLPESDNPHDRLAVSVWCHGERVGYLSRDDARAFRKRLQRKGIAGKPTTCVAELIGGHTLRNGDQASFGVQLMIEPLE